MASKSREYVPEFFNAVIAPFIVFISDEISSLLVINPSKDGITIGVLLAFCEYVNVSETSTSFIGKLISALNIKSLSFLSSLRLK